MELRIKMTEEKRNELKEFFYKKYYVPISKDIANLSNEEVFLLHECLESFSEDVLQSMYTRIEEEQNLSNKN